MYQYGSTQLILTFLRPIYCPCCSLTLSDQNATIVDGWVVCSRCAFSGAYRDPMFRRASVRACVAEHVLWSRNVRGYAPRKRFEVPLPLVELVTALEIRDDPATIALGDN